MITTIDKAKDAHNREVGRSPYSFPGCEIPLSEVIGRLFKVNCLDDKHRKKEKILAKHLFRYMLREHLGWEPEAVARVAGCLRSNIYHSVEVARWLIEYDKEYRGKYDELMLRVKDGVIKWPDKPKASKKNGVFKRGKKFIVFQGDLRYEFDNIKEAQTKRKELCASTEK